MTEIPTHLIPESRSTGDNEKQNQYARIPHLVRDTFVENPKKSKLGRRARSELLGLVRKDSYFDPVLFSIIEVQKLLLSSKETRRIKHWAGLLEDVVTEGLGTPNLKPKTKLHTNTSVVETIEEVEQNAKKIKEKNLLRLVPSVRYEHLTTTLLPSLQGMLQEASVRGTRELIIALKQTPSDMDKDTVDTLYKETEQFNSWSFSANQLLETKEIDFYAKKDMFIELLKTEPKSPLSERKQLFTRKYGKFSLADISKMPYPFPPSEIGEIIDFVTQALSDNNSSDSIDQVMITDLFFTPTFFSTPLGKKFDFQNENFLKNLNYWQELVAALILTDTESTTINDAIVKLLNVMTEGSLEMVMATASNPPDFPQTRIVSKDPRTGRNRLTFKDLHLHPVASMAIEDFSKKNKDQNVDAKAMGFYLDEIGVEYYNTALIPQLKRRLHDLGVYDKFEEEINKMENHAKERPYEILHLDVIKMVFENLAGREFIERLNIHSNDIKEISKIAWNDTTEQMHFLPMEQGENIIEFSEGSIPHILGLKSLHMNRVGPQQDWKISISYEFHSGTFVLFGLLDQDGKLTFKAPLEQQIPGLYSLLNHIAILAFHDLVVQEKKEKQNEPSPNRKSKGIFETLQNILNKGRKEKEQAENLPRTQSDRELIADVYKEIGKTPRRVELHKTTLPRTKEYKAAVELYLEAKSKNATDEETGWARRQVEETRTRSYKISEQKKHNAPAKFKLESIIDPLTNEEIYLQTWVVEHTSPKPTDEELKSPVKLFERYYKGSSALASLDQMKPWLIGE